MGEGQHTFWACSICIGEKARVTSKGALQKVTNKLESLKVNACFSANRRVYYHLKSTLYISFANIQLRPRTWMRKAPLASSKALCVPVKPLYSPKARREYTLRANERRSY